MFGLKRKRDELERQIAEANLELADLQNKIRESDKEITRLNNEIGLKNGIIEMQELGMEYIPEYQASNEIEMEISKQQKELADNLRLKNYYVQTKGYRIDGPNEKGHKFQYSYFENLLMGIDSYFQQKEKSVTNENYYHIRDLMNSAFIKYNKKAALLGFSISDDYLAQRLIIVKLKLDLKNAKDEERARIREEKRRVAEEEKLKAEAEKEKKRLIAEKSRWEKVFGDAMTDEKREEAKAKLEEISQRNAKIDCRLANLKSGWVYVISNPCLEDMVKIGVTKRLDFTKRIDELNAAGVPYNFIVNGVTFSNDCFALESALHDYYDSVRVNKKNRHKEFFRVSPEEVINVMQNKFNCEIHFMKEEDE